MSGEFRAGSRSFTDPLSNATFIRDVDLRRDLGNIMAGRFPTSATVAFIHEFTHHWCLYSPVGSSLALVQLRAVRKLFARLETWDSMTEADKEDVVWDVFDDYIRFDATLGMLRPIFEGLAVFAESDVRPGDSPVASNVTYWLARGFAHGHTADDHDSFAAVGRLLQDVRIFSRRFLERKESLLAEPISAVRTGHLAGYLFVKDLWTEAASADERYHDLDLFLYALRIYLFDDLGLAAHILDPNTRDHGAAVSIGQYVAQRLNSLAQGQFALMTDDVIAAALASPPMSPRTGTSSLLSDAIVNLGTEPTLWKQGRELIQDGVAELVGSPDDDVWGDSMTWLLAQREMLVLGDVPVQVEVSKYGRVSCSSDGAPLLSGPVLEGAAESVREGTYAGSLRAYLFPYQGFQGVSVNVDGRPIFTHCSDEATEMMRDQFASYVSGSEYQVAGSGALRRFVETAVTSDAFIKTVLDTTRESTELWYQTTFAERPVRYLSGDRRATAYRDLCTAGFGAALGGRNALRKLTWLSVLASLSPALEDAEKLFQSDRSFHRCQGTLLDVIEEVRQLTADRLGDELVKVLGPTLLSAV